MVNINFLENREKGTRCVTWGMPWKKGEVKNVKALVLKSSSGESLEMQNKINAYWPDGSVKWSLHSANLEGLGEAFQMTAAEEGGNKASGMCRDKGGKVVVNTGSVEVAFNTEGSSIIEEIRKDNVKVCSGGKLVAITETRAENVRRENTYIGELTELVIEDDGPVRCIIKAVGSHVSSEPENGEGLFRFTLRFYFYKDSKDIRIVHTYTYDGDSEKDFIKGMSMKFAVPMEGELYNRHIKFAGDSGYFDESLQLLLSWRPRIKQELYKGQLAGEEILFSKEDSDYENNMKAVNDMTVWDSYKMYQDSSEHFVIRKKTESDKCCFIDACHGHRSGGVGYVGSPKQGLAVGAKDFWQKYPSSLEIAGASGDMAEVTVWLWPTEGEAADLRHYDTKAHAGAYYEGFDEILSTPYGTSNTNEIFLTPYTEGIPTDQELDVFTNTVKKLPVMVCSPEHYRNTGAFGVWGLPNRESKEAMWFEQQLDNAIEYYKNEVEQRKWYGFFNYGDFMHTYDDGRSCWRYDMGGYAWQNTELVPTLWLWLAFMRSGREDIFTLAEAMTRHTSDVDIYHIGEYKGLGSRHNVVHWGCACKEARIAMAFHHRYYYYLTGDERLGDVFDDVSDAEYGVERLDPLRHFYDDGLKTHARTGPDWSSLTSNWITAWERKNDLVCMDKLFKGMESIKKAPFRLISGSNFGFDPDTGEMIYIGENAAGGSHLVICMGAPSIWMELVDITGDKQWHEMMVEYGRFYMLPPEEKTRISGGKLPADGWSFPYMAASMAAYCAKYENDGEYAQRIWKILRDDWVNFDFTYKEIKGSASKYAEKEISGISTNFIAQWCLNVIMCMGLI